jgi:hypothetical protein
MRLTPAQPASVTVSSRAASREEPFHRHAHALPQQQRVDALLETRWQPRQVTPIPPQLAQVANRRRRVGDPHNAVAAQRIGEALRVESVGLRRVARLDPGLARVDHVDRAHLFDDPIHERPRRTRRLDGDVTLRTAPGEQGRAISHEAISHEAISHDHKL